MSRGDEAGFTLIELVVSSLILPIVVFAITLALMTIFGLQTGVASRIGDSADAQTVAAFYEQDVHNASMLTTSASATQCGTGTQLLGLEWNLNSGVTPNTYQTVVSYSSVSTNGGKSAELIRRYCTNGSLTPSSSMVVISDLPPGQAAATISGTNQLGVSINTLAQAGWTSTVGVTGVTFTTTEPGSSFNYTLFSVPKAGPSASSLTGVGNSGNTSCGFALPGTGTYASSLCFVDFSSFAAVAGKQVGSAWVQPASGCSTIKANIVNTPYTLSFCLSVSTTLNNGQAATYGVTASATPTYTAPPTSEAFLGNNGFYTGIPGEPAIYQVNPGGATSVVTITQIKLLDSNGNAATSWQFVTGDAESTDSTESITWNSDQILNLLPDSPTSPIGNACPTVVNGVVVPNKGFTGVGTTTVVCLASASSGSANTSSDKTGTVLLQAATPTKLTATLVGSGLQAIFVGVLLP